MCIRDRRTVALYAPSKTFNLAGLIGSYHIVYNEALHKRMKKESSLSHYNSMNVLSMHALIGAYSDEGSQWVDAVSYTHLGLLLRQQLLRRQGRERVRHHPHRQLLQRYHRHAPP